MVSDGGTVTIAGSSTIDATESTRTVTVTVQADSIDGAQLADSIALSAALDVTSFDFSLNGG